MKKEHAFTLAELLIALAITSILVVLLANVVNATLTAWRQGRSRLDTFSNARQLIGRLGDEITAAVAVQGGSEFVENAGELKCATAPAENQSENVFFVAPYPNSGGGDLCVIAYRHDANSRRLERAFKDSASAWAASPIDRYKLAGYTGSTGLQWKTVADGVINFEIRAYSEGGENLKNTWNSRAAGDTLMEGKTPRRIQLRIKVVDDRTLARIGALSNQAIDAAAREFIADFTLPAR